MSTYIHLWIAFCTALILWPSRLVAEDPILADVCEIFENLEQWNGKLVRFDAVILPPRGEVGTRIDASKCSPVVVSGVTFDKYLVTADPRKRVNLQGHEAQALDQNSIVQYSEAIKQLNSGNGFLRAHLVGVIDTRTPLTSLVAITKAWPKGITVGFGHLGRAPAQILVVRLEDVRVEHPPFP